MTYGVFGGTLNLAQPRPTQPPILGGTGNKYRPKAMMLCDWEVQAGWFIHMWINVSVAGMIPLNTCHTESFSSDFEIRRYTNVLITILTYYYSVLLFVCHCNVRDTESLA